MQLPSSIRQLDDLVVTFAQTMSAVNGTEKGSTNSTKEWDWHGDKQVK